MKNQREIYEALLAGETLAHTKGFTLKMLSDGKMVNAKTEERKEQHFTWPEDWEIYIEKKWYENIPDGGVLCWNLDAVGTQSDYVSRIDNNTVVNMEKYTPLTKSEIQAFMDNTPPIKEE